MSVHIDLDMIKKAKEELLNYWIDETYLIIYKDIKISTQKVCFRSVLHKLKKGANIVNKLFTNETNSTKS